MRDILIGLGFFLSVFGLPMVCFLSDMIRDARYARENAKLRAIVDGRA